MTGLVSGPKSLGALGQLWPFPFCSAGIRRFLFFSPGHSAHLSPILHMTAFAFFCTMSVNSCGQFSHCKLEWEMRGSRLDIHQSHCVWLISPQNAMTTLRQSKASNNYYKASKQAMDWSLLPARNNRREWDEIDFKCELNDPTIDSFASGVSATRKG